jgi:hypothetical protein
MHPRKPGTTRQSLILDATVRDDRQELAPRPSRLSQYDPSIVPADMLEALWAKQERELQDMGVWR